MVLVLLRFGSADVFQIEGVCVEEEDEEEKEEEEEEEGSI